MTILCITTELLPGIIPCKQFGEHRVTCHDHEGWAEHLRPGRCRGCLPRSADRGYLCQSCWDRLDQAYMRWPQFRRLVVETEGRAVAPEGGGVTSAAPGGYSNLALTFLTLDECDRFLRSRGDRTLDAWVHTEDGARDAIQFAHAAERAYTSLEVEARELQLERVECPHCGHLSLSQNPTRRKQGVTIVDCMNCGELLDKIRDDSDRWVGTRTCEDSNHAECASLHCQCACHDLGSPVDVAHAGAHALWNADLHTWRPNQTGRDQWLIDDPRTIRLAVGEHLERKTA